MCKWHCTTPLLVSKLQATEEVEHSCADNEAHADKPKWCHRLVKEDVLQYVREWDCGMEHATRQKTCMGAAFGWCGRSLSSTVITDARAASSSW